MTASVRLLKNKISKEPGFFGPLAPNKQILGLAGNADSLEHIEQYIRDICYSTNKDLKSTLLYAIAIAISRLDTEMADKIYDLLIEFYPSSKKEALQVAEQASPPEDDITKTARENANKSAIKQIFDAYIANDPKDIPAAKQKFQAFMKSIQPKEIEDNLYQKNLIHLHCAIYKAFLDELSSSKYKDRPNHPIKEQIRKFLIEILGNEIQTKLSRRALQLFKRGIGLYINTGQKALRDDDVSPKFFVKKVRVFRDSRALGVNIYFALHGKSETSVTAIGPGSAHYYTNLSQTAERFYEHMCLQQPAFMQCKPRSSALRYLR